MTIAITGSNQFFEALTNADKNIEWLLTDEERLFKIHTNADAFFFEEIPTNIDDCSNLGGPVFINSVIHSLPEYKNMVRFNGWPGFLENDTWEICGDVNESVENILQLLGKKSILCNDEPGLISARIIAMIINEAFMAKAEGVSTMNEIDTAMKLGTNYPFGPFEWAQKIGLSKIKVLLNKLAENNPRYKPAMQII